jgi:UDP-glucuronate 4-epimerase
MAPYKKHYLITGGAGFIGSNLIKALAEDETIRITSIDNFDPFYPRQLKLLNTEGFEKHKNVMMIERDLTSLSAKELIEIMPQPVDVIIHLAAKAGVRPSIADPIGYQQTNVIGTQVLLDYAKETGVKQFVFASSSSVYGVNKNIPWKETEPLQPISPYAMTKLSCEMAGHVFSHLYGLRFIALRFFTVYGPSQRPDLAIHKFTKAIYQGQPITMFGDGSTSRDYTFVDDIVEGIKGAIDYTGSPFEIMNLGNSYTVSLLQLIQSIEEVVGKKAIIDQQPEQPGDVPQTFSDITKAKQLLNYQPKTDLKSGLEKFHQWFLQHQKLLLSKQ